MTRETELAFILTGCVDELAHHLERPEFLKAAKEQRVLLRDDDVDPEAAYLPAWSIVVASWPLLLSMFPEDLRARISAAKDPELIRETVLMAVFWKAKKLWSLSGTEGRWWRRHLDRELPAKGPGRMRENTKLPTGFATDKEGGWRALCLRAGQHLGLTAQSSVKNFATKYQAWRRRGESVSRGQ